MAKEIDVTELDDKPEVKEGTVVYESDLRAASHSNGRTPHLVEPEVRAGGGEGPPDLPEEPSFPRKPEGGAPNQTLQVLLAVTYIGFGIAGLYVGITMLRDLRGKKEKPNG